MIEQLPRVRNRGIAVHCNALLQELALALVEATANSVVLAPCLDVRSTERETLVMACELFNKGARLVATREVRSDMIRLQVTRNRVRAVIRHE